MRTDLYEIEKVGSEGGNRSFCQMVVAVLVLKVEKAGGRGHEELEEVYILEEGHKEL